MAINEQRGRVSLSGSQLLAWARAQAGKQQRGRRGQLSASFPWGGKHLDGPQRFQQADTVDSAAIKLEAASHLDRRNRALALSGELGSRKEDGSRLRP